MLVGFIPAISAQRSKSNYVSNNMANNRQQSLAFGNYDAGVKTAEDFFKKGLSIETFLTRLDRTEENNTLVLAIRAKAAEMKRWGVTGIIDGKWFKTEPVKH